MPIIHYRAPIKVLVAVRGHPFDRNAFDAMFLSMEGITATMVDQPAAAQLMRSDTMAAYDALLLYDMPGLDFMATHASPSYVMPSSALQAGFRAVLERGIGIVALHHALAGWPAWPEYGEWLGGRFLYHPGEVRGVACLDSGYAQAVTYQAELLAEHPVTRGLPQVFSMTDELYLAEVFTNEVTPLVASQAVFSREHFWSADAAVSGRMHSREGWDHPPASNLIAWVKRAVNSPVVYLQPGDGRSAYDNPHYRRLLENAVRWVVSDESRR